MLIERDSVQNGIVFCNRKSEVDVVAKSLKQHGFDAAPIHGDLDQSLRTKTLAAFRSGDLKILVASDVAARGLDIPDVSHVFNYDVSHHADDYVHRIGRTGRAGKLGQTFMIVTPADDKGLDKVLKLIKMAPEELVLDIDWSNLGGGRRTDSKPDARPDRPARGRSRTERPAPEPTAESPQAAEAVAAEPAEAAEPARRTRSRRGSRTQDAAPIVQAETTVAETVVADAPVVEAASAKVATAPRPAHEPRLRQSERNGSSRSNREDAPAREGAGFGADVPAFMRRAAPIGR